MHLVFPLEPSVTQSQMFLMITIILGIDQNIVDEYHDESIKILHEHLVHQIHEVGWCIS
jgi:hypothetical protein